MKSWALTAVRSRLLPLGFCWLLVAPAVSSAQVLTVTVHVRNGAGEPLWNAEVIDQERGRRVLTNQRGEATMTLDTRGATRLRARQIGYRFADSLVAPQDVRAAAILFTLQRVVYSLPANRVALRADCDFGADTAGRVLAADALEQLRVAAERYDQLRKADRYTAKLVRRSVFLDSVGTPFSVREDSEQTRLDRWGERYREGRVVLRRPIGFSVPFLHLQNFADPAFWKTHCFAVTEWVDLGEHRVLRLNFWPTKKVRTADWAGWALLDSATSELRRVEFRLVGVREDDRPWKFEGYTTFTVPMPFFVMPDSAAAIWWREKPKTPGAPPDMAQLIRLTRLEIDRR